MKTITNTPGSNFKKAAPVSAAPVPGTAAKTQAQEEKFDAQNYFKENRPHNLGLAGWTK